MKKGEKEYIYYKRAFLNREGFHTRAYVLATVHHDYSRHALSLADCEQVIHLTFPMDTPQQSRNSLYKADLLAKTVADFRDGLREYAEVSKQRDREAQRASRERPWS